MNETYGAKARRVIRDLAELLDTLDPDVVWDNRGTSPPDHHGVFRGKAEVARIITEWVACWENYRLHVHGVEELGDHVILEVTESGVGRSSGVEIRNRHFYRWTFRDGLIVSGSGGHNSKEEALADIDVQRNLR